jgi:excisionase family DNA binding protein
MQVGEFYTVQGAARALGLSYWTVYRYVRRSNVPRTYLGSHMLLRLEDLSELETRAEAPAPWGKECPECGSLALVHEEGCQKCHACGYSVC